MTLKPGRASPLPFLFVTVFIDMIGYGIVVPLLPFYAQQYAPSALLIGILGSLYAAMQFVCGPVLGGISDRAGRRPVLITCLLGVALAYLLLGMANSLTALVAAVALAGCVSGTLATAQAYVADSTSPERRARGLGLIGAACGLGLIAGPAAGGLLSLHSLSAPAFAAAGLALTNAAFGFLILPESLQRNRREKTPLLRLNPVSQLSSVLRKRNIRAFLFVVFLLNLAFAGLLTNFPLFSSTRFGWEASDNAFFFAFVGLCAALTQGGLIGWLQPRYGETKLLLSGLALMAADLGLVSFAPSAWMLYPIVGLLALGSGLAIPAVTSLISRRVPDSRQGSLMGGMQAIMSLALILGPLVAGLSFDRLGPSAPYWIGGVLAALALAAALPALRGAQPPGSPSRSEPKEQDLELQGAARQG